MHIGSNLSISLISWENFFGEYIFVYLHLCACACTQVSGSEEEIHHRTEGAQAERAESLCGPERHQSHHGHEVFPGQNVSCGGLWGFFSVHAGIFFSEYNLFSNMLLLVCTKFKCGCYECLLNCTRHSVTLLLLCLISAPLMKSNEPWPRWGLPRSDWIYACLRMGWAGNGLEVFSWIYVQHLKTLVILLWFPNGLCPPLNFRTYYEICVLEPVKVFAFDIY